MWQPPADKFMNLKDQKKKKNQNHFKQSESLQKCYIKQSTWNVKQDVAS